MDPWILDPWIQLGIIEVYVIDGLSGGSFRDSTHSRAVVKI